MRRPGHPSSRTSSSRSVQRSHRATSYSSRAPGRSASRSSQQRSGRWKMLLLVLIAVIVSIVADHLQIQHSLFVPVFNVNIPLAYAWYPFIFLVIAGTANATNLADGVDGLAAGTGIIAVFTFTA